MSIVATVLALLLNCSAKLSVSGLVRLPGLHTQQADIYESKILNKEYERSNGSEKEFEHVTKAHGSSQITPLWQAIDIPRPEPLIPDLGMLGGCPNNAIMIQGEPAQLISYDLLTAEAKDVPTSAGNYGNGGGFDVNSSYIVLAGDTGNIIAVGWEDDTFTSREFTTTNPEAWTLGSYRGDVLNFGTGPDQVFRNGLLMNIERNNTVHTVELDFTAIQAGTATWSTFPLTAPAGGTFNPPTGCADVAFHPKFLSLTENSVRARWYCNIRNTLFQGTLDVFNQSATCTIAATFPTPANLDDDLYGASFFDLDGYFYSVYNANGIIIRFDLTDPDVTPGAPIIVGDTGINTNINDGARCPFSSFRTDVYDYGHAPDSYSTLRNSNGARHLIGVVTTDIQGQENVFVTEESVCTWQGNLPELHADMLQTNSGFLSAVETGEEYTVALTVNRASTDVMRSYIQLYIDFDRDGSFEQEKDLVFDNYVVDWSNTMRLSLEVREVQTAPVFFGMGDTYARVRYSCEMFQLPENWKGEQRTGEVEDYIVELVDIMADGYNYGTAPDSYGTLIGSGGPRHEAGRTFDNGGTETLWQVAKVWNDVPPVVTTSPVPNPDQAITQGLFGEFVPSTTNTISLDMRRYSTDVTEAYVSLWIDFNQNGVFDDDEEIFLNERYTGWEGDNLVGENILTFNVPDIGCADPNGTWARLRITPTMLSSGTGGAVEGGEVEDHRIVLNSGSSCCTCDVLIAEIIALESAIALKEQNRRL